MPSEMPVVVSRRRGSAPWSGVFLLCLFCGPAVGFSATPSAAVKNKPPYKPEQTTKSVFSVSVGDSTALMPVSSNTFALKADTGPQALLKTAKGAQPPAPAAPIVQKKAADTVKKSPVTPATVAPKVSAPPVSQDHKRKQSLTCWNRYLSVKTLVLFLCAVLIYAALRFVTKRKAAPRFLTTTRLSVMDKEVQRACRYIEMNFADPDLSLKSICNNLITGEAFLEALMERDLGVTVNDFIVHVRINHAKQILEKGAEADNETIERVARETGFASGAAFCAAFTKITGVPFGEYVQLRNLKNV